MPIFLRLNLYYKTLIQHEGFKKYFLNTSWQMLENGLRLISGVFVGAWVARYLGPSSFGAFNYSIAFCAMYAGFAKLGLDSIIIRELIKFPEDKYKYLGTSFWIKTFSSFFFLLLLVVSALFAQNETDTRTYILIMSLTLIFQSFEVIDFYFQSEVKSKYISISKIVQLIISSICKLYLVHINAGLIYFVWIVVLDQLSLSASLIFSYFKDKNLSFFKFYNNKITFRLFKNCWPLILSGIALMIQARLDQLFLKQFISSKELGIYGAALKLIEVASFVPVVICNSIFPAVLNAEKVSHELFVGRLYSLYRLMMLLFILMAIPLIVLSKQIISLLYGPAFAAAAPLLSLMVFRLFFTNFGVARSVFLMTKDLLRYSLITLTIGAVVNVILNYYLIPRYASYGAIWASTISFFVTSFLIDIFYSKTRENCFYMLKSIFVFEIGKKSRI